MRVIILGVLVGTSISLWGSALRDELLSVPVERRCETVANVIWRGVRDDHAEYLAGLISGMQAAAEGPDASDGLSSVLQRYSRLSTLEWAKANAAASGAFFQALVDNPEYTALRQDSLYIRVLEQGRGQSMNDVPEFVTISYLIQPIEGTSSYSLPNVDILSEHRTREFHIAALIPGLAWGLHGMRLGEVREILIHPSLAYGESSQIEPGISLRVKVRLDGWREASDPIAIVHPKTNVLPAPPSDEINRALWEAGFADGRRCWSHYSKAGELLPLEAVVEQLEALATDSDWGGAIDMRFYSRLQCLLAP